MCTLPFPGKSTLKFRISGLTCKPLGFAQNLILIFIIVSTKNYVKTRSQGTFSTQKWNEQILMIDSNWYSEIYPTFHFYCLILVLSSTSSASLWADGRGQSCRQSDLRFEKRIIHVVPPRGVFLEGFSRMKPTFLSGHFIVAPASVSPLQSLSFSHTASFQSCKHAQVLLPQGFHFPCFPSQVALC